MPNAFRQFDAAGALWVLQHQGDDGVNQREMLRGQRWQLVFPRRVACVLVLPPLAVIAAECVAVFGAKAFFTT